MAFIITAPLDVWNSVSVYLLVFVLVKETKSSGGGYKMVDLKGNALTFRGDFCEPFWN